MVDVRLAVVLTGADAPDVAIDFGIERLIGKDDRAEAVTMLASHDDDLVVTVNVRFVSVGLQRLQEFIQSTWVGRHGVMSSIIR